MAAEGLPAGTPTGAMPGWELEAWYQDLQEVLAAAEPSGPSLPWGAEQGSGGDPEGCELDAALAAELLELLGPESAAGTEPVGPRPLCSASSSSPPPQPGGEGGEAGPAAGRGVKRKRSSGGGRAASREQAKQREQVNQQRVLELEARNQQLREEIGRLSAEVERTRAALIQHVIGPHPP
ncbi:DDIT3 protein, partial [Jacana jacana]|nr:DDIT3 protein [Jacana jacana]